MSSSLEFRQSFGQIEGMLEGRINALIFMSVYILLPFMHVNGMTISTNKVKMSQVCSFGWWQGLSYESGMSDHGHSGLVEQTVNFLSLL